MLALVLGFIALLAAGRGLPAQRFEPAGAGARPAPTRPERGPDLARYRLRDDRLVRSVGDGPGQALDCTHAGGTGAVHAWSHHPGGTTYVAAEHGLFTISLHGADEAPVRDLDPLEL